MRLRIGLSLIFSATTIIISAGITMFPTGCPSHHPLKRAYKMNGYIETMWAIHGNHGLYTGTWLTRKEAIKAHLASYVGRGILNKKEITRLWKIRKAKGDRAVKVEMTYTV